MITRAPHFVMIGIQMGRTRAAVCAVQVSRRKRKPSDPAGDGIHLWHTELVDLREWDLDTIGPPAAAVVERAYLMSVWHHDSPVAVCRPRPDTADAPKALGLYGAVVYGLQDTHRRTVAVVEAVARRALTGDSHATNRAVMDSAGQMVYSAGHGASPFMERLAGTDDARKLQCLAIGVALAGGRHILDNAHLEPEMAHG